MERTQLFFSGVEVIPLEAELAEAAGHLARTLRQKGYTVGLADAVVAATAQHLDVPVLTANEKRFEHVPGLRVRDLREALSEDARWPRFPRIIGSGDRSNPDPFDYRDLRRCNQTPSATTGREPCPDKHPASQEQ